jgi:hypothetical protein
LSININLDSVGIGTDTFRRDLWPLQRKQQKRNPLQRKK